MQHNVFAAFVIVLVVFVPFERLFALRRQRVFRKGWLTDLAHFFVSYFLVQVGVFLVFVVLTLLLGWAVSPGFQASVAAQPGWLQFLEAFLIAEVAFYLAHRLSHEVPFLWRFHSVHHSIEEMDWLASARIHPVDQVFVKSMMILPLYVMGFTEQTFGVYLALTALQAIFVHANVRFRFGPLRWVFSTPEFHHWHHAAETQAHDKNYAGQLPLLDLLFGTLYMPKHRMPESYGIAEPVPSNYLGQMAYPFRRRPSRRRLDSSAATAPQETRPTNVAVGHQI